MTAVRWRVMVMLCLSGMISYVDRVNLSFVAPDLMREFRVGPAEMGVVLSAFVWTYMLLQVPGGMLLDRWGPRWLLGAAACLWGAATMLTATATGLGSLVLWRGLLGVGEAPVTPGGTKVIGTWMADRERGLASGIMIAGVPLGTCLGSPLIGWLLSRYGWQTVFVVTGLLALAWAVAWVAYYRAPARHRGADAAERAHVARNNSRLSRQVTPVRVGWGALLRNRNVLGLSLGHAALLFNLYFFLSWLPTFLIQQHHLSILRTGFSASIPWLFGLAGSLLSGHASDVLIRRGWRPIEARKLFMGTGMVLCMAAFFSVLTTSLGWTVAWLSVAVFGLLLTNGVVWAANADISPEAQGAQVSGMQNFIGNVGGMLAPIVTGALVQLTGSWVSAMAAAACVALLGAWAYVGLLRDGARFGLGTAAPTAAGVVA